MSAPSREWPRTSGEHTARDCCTAAGRANKAPVGVCCHVTCATGCLLTASKGVSHSKCVCFCVCCCRLCCCCCREVFAELVPGGRGELVMIKRKQVGGGAGRATHHSDCIAVPCPRQMQQPQVWLQQGVLWTEAVAVTYPGTAAYVLTTVSPPGVALACTGGGA